MIQFWRERSSHDSIILESDVSLESFLLSSTNRVGSCGWFEVSDDVRVRICNVLGDAILGLGLHELLYFFKILLYYMKP